MLIPSRWCGYAKMDIITSECDRCRSEHEYCRAESTSRDKTTDSSLPKQ